ncbi:MAG: molybdopterin-dependent oxidoreductase [Chloroflexi bacterium]|nr:molybdopterin-dependent oxidoreductase [Chloroflexota bacterium]
MKIHEDVWIPTQCGRCYAGCAMRVRRVNGVAVKIEGMPDTDMGAQGGLCAKGEASLQVLYDPNRLNVPLRRTNPEKGLHADPKWKEISWEEALDEIVTKLKKVLTEDPSRLIRTTSYMRSPGTGSSPLGTNTAQVIGWGGGGGLHCGGGTHETAGMIHGSWSITPDFRYCNYALYFGATKGTGAGHSAMVTARQAAEARARGMKMIVFDPICNYPGAKATEWVPIIPGTDAAVILAMCNVIVNELGIVDRTYIATKTNGPYLVGPDGKYVREEHISEEAARMADTRMREEVARIRQSGQMMIGESMTRIIGGTSKPLVWDAIDKKAKVYDDPTIKEFALEGEYEVIGLKGRIKCHPAWQMVKEDLKKNTLEMASKASTVPPQTIRRIATEFAHEARVGSTITLDGHVLPFRPVSAIIFRGGSSHSNSLHTCLAVALLNSIVGCSDVPGGTLGWPARCVGYPETGEMAFSPYTGVDGFLETDGFGPGATMHGPWPIHLPHPGEKAMVTDIIPLLRRYPWWIMDNTEEIWQKTGVDHPIDMILGWGNNVLLNLGGLEKTANFLKKVPFTVIFEHFNTELTEGFADIVLPDTCFLEEENWHSGTGVPFNYPPGMDDWCFHTTQRVLQPMHQRRPMYEVLDEINDRLGLTTVMSWAENRPFPRWTVREKDKLRLEEKLSRLENADRTLKRLFGPEHGWEWFKEHGFIRWPKKVEEAYWRYFVKCRTPIYLEYMIHLKEAQDEIFQRIGFDGFDQRQYTPFISWFPILTHNMAGKPEYDLQAFSYRDALHSGTHTLEQPWLDEMSQMNPYTYTITMNAEMAKKKGLKDGDPIELESDVGRKARGTLKIMEGQHPETIGIAACSGHWAKGMPIARGKGTNFDQLLELDMQHVDPVSGNMELGVMVKVRKLEEV